MASQHRKHRGYATERLVANYLQQWWRNASVGRGQGKDVLNVPFDIEIKARNSLDIKGTLRQIKARTAKTGELGFACFRLNGQGEASVEEFVCMLTLGDLVELLRKAEYDRIPSYEGDIDWEAMIDRCNKCGTQKIRNWRGKPCEPPQNHATLGI
jgi:hypothetical protein